MQGYLAISRVHLKLLEVIKLIKIIDRAMKCYVLKNDGKKHPQLPEQDINFFSFC